jgi:acetyl-CoA carboxylase carboxyl transferase subunit beta
MQEGILSLMQMPRSIIALQMVKEAGLPVVMLLAHPTTGGVAASFAALGDLTFAEPGAIIGFTGARVIQDTLRQPLPDGFQTSEFQKKHGFVDLITPRQTFRDTFSDVLRTLNHLVGA